MQNRIFETWSIKGTRFLSVPADQGVRIIDQAGNNYGTWFSVDEFKKRCAKDGRVALALNDCVIRISVIINH